MSDVILLYAGVKCSAQGKSKPKLSLKYWIFLSYNNVIGHL